MSESGDLPTDVTAALDACVDSLTGLELVVLLARDPRRSWSLDEITAQLGQSRPAVQREVDRLAGLRLIADGDGAVPRFRMASETAQRDAVHVILTCYGRRRAAVVNYVATRAMSRLQRRRET